MGVNQLLFGQYKDFVVVVIKFKSGKWYIWILFYQMYYVVIDFINQNFVVVEIIWCVVEDMVCQFQVVVFGGQFQYWFMFIFFWQIGYVFFIDIWWIGDDQIVLQFWQIVEQVGMDWCYVMDQVVGFNVVFGDGQCVWGDIYCIDFCFWEGIGVGDGDVVVIGVYIKDVLWFMVNQFGKLVIDQFVNWGVWYQYLFINVKFMVVELCFVGQIGDGNMFVYVVNYLFYNVMFFVGGQVCSVYVFWDIQWQIQ